MSYRHDRRIQNALDVEADVITWKTSLELLVMHFDGLDFSGDVRGSKSHDHSGFDGASLDTTDRHGTDTTDLIDVLEG